MAITAQQSVQSGRIRLKRKFGDFGTALGALPIPFVHLSLEIAATAIIVKIHFDSKLSDLFGLRIQQNGLNTHFDAH